MSTALNVIQQAYKMLTLTTVTTTPGLFGGADENGAPVITPTAQALFWATEAQNRLTRLCLPIQDYAAAQPAEAGAQTLAPYTSLISPSRRPLHTGTDVFCNGLRLTATSAGFIRAANWYPPALSGDPTAWSNLNSGIGLSAYTTQPWCTVNGYALPAPLTTTDQVLDANIDDYAQIGMWAYLAWRIAVSNQDNPVLMSRIAPCRQQFIEVVREMYTRLISNDTNLSTVFVSTDIDTQAATMSQEAGGS